MLAGKVAVVYGAGGSVGGAVAVAFARDGARVFLAGRTRSTLEAAQERIAASGGQADVAPVDALDGQAVGRHADEIIAKAGRLDISFNCIEMGETQGAPLTDTSVERFILPIETAMRAHYFTGTAAARHMAQQGSGVLMTITANAAIKPHADAGGFAVACAALEALYRQFAVELGPQGIRAVVLRSAGSPDAKGVSEAFDLFAANQGISRAEFDRKAGESTLLKHLPSLAEVADAAVIMASDRARAVTAAVANVTCGQLID
jgi:NAD(P)-dependent dehydrogenase (short-subunit alcohol dehydrogenase family)